MRNHWMLAILKLNWANLTANKKAFTYMVIVMCLQSLIYFALWAIFFSQISSLRGWGLKDVAALYGASALGYGFIFSLFGGFNKLGDTIQTGALDTHLARPRSPLLLAVMERMRADSMGDFATGLVMMVVFVHPPIQTWPLLAVLSLTAGLICVAFRLIVHTLAFWGISGEAAENLYMAFFVTATNPQKGFNPYLKLVLLTLLPAGYVGFLPVEIMRHFDWRFLAMQMTGCAVICSFAIWLFHVGLRRYASGNKFLLLR